MTDREKVIWKVEILKQSEDMDDLIDAKIKQIQDERLKIAEVVEGNKGLIAVYEEAVDRIAKQHKKELKKSTSDSDLKKKAEEEKRGRRVPQINTMDVEDKAKLKPKAQLNKFSNISNLLGSQRQLSAGRKDEPIPEVFNRLYRQDQLNHCCDACKSGPCDHNKPDKKPKSHRASRGSSKAKSKGYLSARGSSKGKASSVRKGSEQSM